MTDRTRRTTQRDESQEEEFQNGPPERGGEVAEKIDDLLDEIDSVLEENAEEFVKNYVQKGGE